MTGGKDISRVFFGLVVSVLVLALIVVTAFFYYNHNRLSSKLADKKTEIQKAAEKIDKLESDRRNLLSAHKAELGQVNQKKDEAINNYRAELSSLGQKLKDCQKASSGLREKIKQEKKKCQTSISNLESKLKSVTSGCAELEKSFQTTSAIAGQCKLNLAQKEKELAANKQEIARLRECLADKRSKLAKTREMLAQANTVFQEQSDILQTGAREADELQAEVKHLKISAENSKQEIVKLRGQKERLEQKLADQAERIRNFSHERRYYASMLEQIILGAMAEKGRFLGQIYFKLGRFDSFLDPSKAYQTLGSVKSELASGGNSEYMLFLLGQSNEVPFRNYHYAKNSILAANRAEYIAWQLRDLSVGVKILSVGEFLDNEKCVKIYLVKKEEFPTIDLLCKLKKRIIKQ
jgi:uncharacterized protein YoxC